MREILIGMRRGAFAIFALAFLLWLVAQGSQWLLRWRAGRMLADVEAIQIGQTTSSVAESYLRQWSKWGSTHRTCQNKTCYVYADVRNSLLWKVRGEQDPERENLLSRVMDHMGLRASAIFAELKIEDGIVVQREFSETVALPVKDWLSRGGAFVPDLVVSSSEVTKLRDIDRMFVSASDPSLVVRRMKGPYGVLIKFNSGESAARKSTLMDFRFSCVTQFRPCSDEHEILPEALVLLAASENQE